MPVKNSFLLEKIEDIGKLEVWIVDGRKIRERVDREFTNFGQHYHFNFIPENEFWIDKEAVPDERWFFIEHLLTEYKLMKNGLPYEKATELAGMKERFERLKAKDIQKLLDKVNFLPPNSVHEKKIGEAKNRISVWVVDGKIVRSAYFVDFTEGGHDLVYSFVPDRQVWLDNDLEEKEHPYILLHELYERSLMKKGFTYLQAHSHASRLEWNCRHDPEKLKERLLEQGWSLDEKK